MSTSHSILSLARVGAVLAQLALLAIGTSSAMASAPPSVTISPLPGTPDASPRTQISFLGAPQADLRHILVRGSRTGLHYGKLEGYSTGEGASFLPSKQFAEGEHVQVSAEVISGKTITHITSSFTIGHPYVLSLPGPTKQPSTNPSYIQSFHSVANLHPPAVSITTAASDPELGDIFITPSAGPGQYGPMIFEPNGQLVWFQAMPANVKAMDLRVQQYYGEPVLTWWQGTIVDGHGQGEDIIESASYKRLGSVHAGNGLYADLHEFELTPKGTALITAYAPVHWNLSSDGGPSNGLLDDGVIQEIDVRTGLVMFEWHALGHVKIADSYEPVPHASTSIYDYFHINSIQLEPEGDILLDARNTWSAYLIDPHNGVVLWRVGGKKSSFTLGPGVRFAWQHDAELLSGGVLSVFDDEDSPPESSQSRALYISLNFKSHTATLQRQFTQPNSPILSPSQGNAQLLPGGDELVGWGQAGFISEFADSGALTFGMHLPPLSNSYRAYRFPWSAEPTSPPAVSAAAGPNGSTLLYASWNGATNVAGWQVLAGASANSLQTVGSFPHAGFETTITAPTAAPFLAVQALSVTGAVLSTSPTVKR